MSIEDHRARYAAELAEEGPGDGEPAPVPVPAAEAGAVARAADEAADRRIAAVDALQTTAVTAADQATRDDAMTTLFELLADPGTEPAVRRAALDELQAMTFSATAFAPYAADYRHTLQSLAVDDDPQMRDRALEILTLEGDGEAQRHLLDGLRGEGPNLVDRARALQLIGQDVHAEDRGLVREIAETTTDPDERLDALRALGADQDSVPLFRRILEDKEETADARATSLSALQALDRAGEDFTDVAQQLVLDASDFDDVRTLALTALAVQPGPTPPGLDQLPGDETGRSEQFEEAVRLYQHSQDLADG